MRRHDRFARLAPSFDRDAFHTIVRAEHLVQARFEPGIGDRYEGLLDLVFERERRYALVPYVVIAGMMLVLRESSPFLWPAWLPPLRSAAVEEIEERVEPWLRSLVLGRVDAQERRRSFTSDPGVESDLQRARDAGWLAAAPAATALRSAAPYVYAQRFAAGRAVLIEDPAGAYGAALLAGSAGSVRCSLRDRELEALAARWYALEVFGSIEGAVGDLEVAPKPARATPYAIALDAGGGRSIAIAEPLPPAVMVSFDLEDAPPCGAFAVSGAEPRVRRSAVAAPPIVGGSAGRIGIVVRDDADRSPDCDTDAARALCLRLGEQGFTAEVIGCSRVDASRWDALHAFGLRQAPQLVPVLDRARAQGTPVVLTPYADDPSDEAAWGSAIGGVALAVGADEAAREAHFEAIAARNLAAPGVPARGAAPLAADPHVRRVLAGVAAVYTSGEGEARYLHQLGYEGFQRVVPALLGDEPPLEPIGALVGSGGFVLVHAPVEPRANQYLLATAARRLGVPLVLVGVVRDHGYYAAVQAALGTLACWLPEAALTPGELAALYAAARVYADASWRSSGLHRIARAAAYGCAVVAPSSGYARSVFPELVREADPASAASIAAALAAAWEEAPQTGPRLADRAAQAFAPLPLLAAILAGYQQIKPVPLAADN